MKEFRIPMLPMPFKMALSLSKSLKPFAKPLLFINPGLQRDLDQAGVQMEKMDYITVVAFTTLLYFCVLFITIFALSRMSTIKDLIIQNENFVPILEEIYSSPEILELQKQVSRGEITKQDAAYEEERTLTLLIERKIFSYLLFVPFLTVFIVLVQSMFYPGSIARSKAKNVEKNLLYMLRHMTVQVRSGSTLFDSLKSIAASEYGVISEDSAELVKNVASGGSMQTALDQLILRNRSDAFRKIIWQIQNAIVSGANLGELFLQLSDRYFEDQKVAISKFGKDLNSFSMMFLVLTVIFPIMAIIMLVVAALLPVPSVPPEYLFAFLGFLGMIQFNLIQMIKEKRPPVHF